MAMQDDFGIKITADGKSAIDSIEQVSDKLHKLDSRVSVLENSFANMIKNITSMLDGLGSAVDKVGSVIMKGVIAGAIFEFAKKTVQVITNASHELVALDNTAKSLYSNVNKLRDFQLAFKEVGFSASDLNSTLSSIQSKLISMRFSPDVGFASSLGMLGVTKTLNKQGQTRSSTDILQEVISNSLKSGIYKNRDLFVHLLSNLGVGTEQAVSIANNPYAWQQRLLHPSVTSTIDNQAIAGARKVVKTGADIEQFSDNYRYKSLGIVNKLYNVVGVISNNLQLITQKIVGTSASVFNTASNYISKNVVKPWEQTGWGSGTAGKTKQDILNDLATYVGRIESRNDYNLSSKTSTAYGRYQYLKSTFEGYGGDWSKRFGYGEQNKVFKTEVGEFVKKFLGGNFNLLNSATAQKMFELSHHLGADNLLKALKNKNIGDITSYENLYRNSYSGKLLQSALVSNGKMPNNQVDIGQFRKFENAIHIGTMHVHTNNVSQFQKEMNDLSNQQFKQLQNNINFRQA